MKFRGVVEAIECAPLRPRGGLDWVIRTRVIEVVEGEFSGATFAFRVHSPSRAGLEIGQTYTIEAEEIDEGFTVDEDQFRP